MLQDWFSRTDVKLIAIDADDTIWYDSTYFRALQQAVVDLSWTYGKEEKVVISLLNSGLARNSAGEKGYALAILETANQIGITGQAQDQLRKEVNNFLNHPVKVLPFAHESLVLMSNYRRLLLTKGQRSEQEKKLNQSGLSELFEAVVIIEKKNPGEMKKVFDSIRASFQYAIVIGNDVKHDIIPAVQNGGRAIWLNHAENIFGRNDTLPSEACEVNGWEVIYNILIDKTRCSSPV